MAAASSAERNAPAASDRNPAMCGPILAQSVELIGGNLAFGS
jgi:hypothetical protein